MNKKLGLAVLTAMIGTSVAYANPDPKKIYPWVPIPKEQITSKLKYLAEDNNPITNISQINAQRLHKANTKIAPWTGPYWPLKQGGIANPYMERTFLSYATFIPLIDAIEPYDKRKNYVETRFAQLSEKEIAKLAPSEKYDLLLGNDLDLSNRIWDFINQWKEDMKWNYIRSIDLPESEDGEDWEIEKKNYIVANWEGICHGWAPASGVIPKPQKTVNATLPDGRKVPFYPEDIKGLISQTWANSIIQDYVLSEGLRCKRRSPKRDKYGRYYDHIPENGEILPRCADVHPAVMHLALVNLVGKQGRSFIIDKAATIAVANQPVKGYEFEYFDPYTGRDRKSFNEALRAYDERLDLYRNERHHDTAFLVGVESTIIYADWGHIKKPSSRSYNKDKYSDLVSLYDLEIDKNGNIIGGQWRGYKDLNDYERAGSNEPDSPRMVVSRPDFFWVVPKDYSKFFQGPQLKEKWDIRSGKQAPMSWQTAAKNAHAFIYENSKHYGNYELCKVKNSDGVVKEVPCEFRYPRPQPLVQIINQLVDLSK
ncbi:MAG TPA: hypothetical protein VKZ84_02060 [Bacteriovoracaceae bacterium]|nr:hypothetical protein [Bacteriovoracaceae bacterium]